MRPNTIHLNDCGNCKHWIERPEAKQRYFLHIGDCDKIPAGTCYEWDDSFGDHHMDVYMGYSFEDECYDEEFHCFEPEEEEQT